MSSSEEDDKKKPFDLQKIYKQVRELLQDESLPEDQLQIFMRSQMFMELCPEFHEEFMLSEKTMSKKTEKAGSSKQVSKRPEEVSKTKESKPAGKENDESRKKKSRVKVVESSDSENSCPPKRHKSEDELKKKKKLLQKRPKVVEIGSSSSDDDSNDRKQVHKKLVKNKEVSKSKSPPGSSDEKKEEGPKIHPFYLGKMGPVVQQKGKLFESDREDDEEEEDRKRERERQRKKRNEEIKKKKSAPPPVVKVREPKPFSFYSRSSAKINRGSKTWKPVAAAEFNRKQRRFKLKPLSVVLVDLLNLDTFFHSPDLKGPPASAPLAVPLKRHMNITAERGVMIERLEKLKSEKFKVVLNKLYGKSLQSSRDNVSSTDGERGKKGKRVNNQRRVSSTDSSSSDPIVSRKEAPPNRGRNKGNNNPVAARKVEQRKKQQDTKGNAEKGSNNRGTGTVRKLPWENPQYFGQKKDPKVDKKELTAKEREKKIREDRIKAQANAPAVAFHKILAQIDSAKKQQEKKPMVALRIPKMSERKNEYVKPSRPVKVGDVATEVSKLLASDSKVDVPICSSSGGDISDYTIRKIAWWFLKSEKEPADDVLFHPELHDDEIMEPWYDPGDHESDVSSVGCVSDPEGITKQEQLKEQEKPNYVLDPDVADEYCGLQSLEARIRRKIPGAKEDVFKTFFKVRPGSNYEKENFEAKCFLCEQKVVGQRDLGAHIRSSQHKNHFRNCSLNIANYEESTVPAVPKKIFNAKLVEYAIENPVSTESTDTSNNINKKVETQTKGNDSPRACIDGEDDSPEGERNEIPLDELSLPSLTMFDLLPDEDQRQAKFALKSNGLWTNEMEGRWMKMLEEEARITENYNNLRERYINAPDTHPLQHNEWLTFWDRRSCELEADGKNPDEYDFASEWMVFWLKKMQEIMKANVEQEILVMKQRLRMDFASLQNLLDRAGLRIDVVKSRSASNVVSTAEMQVDPMVRTNPTTEQVTSNIQQPLPVNTPLADIKMNLNVHIPNNDGYKDSKPFRASENQKPLKPFEDRQKPTTIENSNLSKPEFFKLSKSSENPRVPKPSENTSKPVEARKMPTSLDDSKMPKPPEISRSMGDSKMLTTPLDTKPDDSLKIMAVVTELPAVKKLPPAPPPPPKISLESKGHDYNSNAHRRDSSADRTNRSRDDRYRRDRRDDRRRPSPDDGRSRKHYDNKNDDRKRSYKRSRSRERRDQKYHDDQNDRRHRRPSNDSDSLGSDWEPKSKKSKEVIPTHNSKQPEKSSTESKLIDKDLPTLLKELEKLTEMERLASKGESDTINNLAAEGSVTNVSVEMDEIPIKTETNAERSSSNLLMVKESDLEEVSPVEAPSSPEEGELNSSVCSMSNDVDAKPGSSFERKKNRSKRKKQKKWKPSPMKDSGLAAVSDVSSSPNNNVSDNPAFPSPSKLDPTSIGYHLLSKQRGAQDKHKHRNNERSRSSSDRRYRNSIDLLEEINPIGHKEHRRKSKEESLKGVEAISSGDGGKDVQESSYTRHYSPNNKSRNNQKPGRDDYKKPNNWRPPGPKSKTQNNNNRNNLPQPPSTQAWMEESWEDDGAPIPLPTSSIATKPKDTEENWEDETWATDENVKSSNLLPGTAKASTSDDAPYSPGWDEGSNDVVSKPSNVPHQPGTSQVATNKSKSRRNRRGGKGRNQQRENSNHVVGNVGPWNTNPNLVNPIIPVIPNFLPGMHQPAPNFQNAFNHPSNYINQGWNPNSNPAAPPQGFPAGQYHPGFGGYQFNWQ